MNRPWSKHPIHTRHRLRNVHKHDKYENPWLISSGWWCFVKEHSPLMKVLDIGRRWCHLADVHTPRLKCVGLECCCFPLSKISLLKCTSLLWRCYDRCMQDFVDVAFHFSMSLSKCTHVMSAACTPWLMISTIGLCHSPESQKYWLMVSISGWSRYRSTNAHMPHYIRPNLGWCCMTLSNFTFLMSTTHIICMKTLADVACRLFISLWWCM